MAPVTITPEGGKAALEAAYLAARDDNWDGAGSKRVEHGTYGYAKSSYSAFQTTWRFPTSWLRLMAGTSSSGMMDLGRSSPLASVGTARSHMPVYSGATKSMVECPLAGLYHQLY